MFVLFFVQWILSGGKEKKTQASLKNKKNVLSYNWKNMYKRKAEKSCKQKSLSWTHGVCNFEVFDMRQQRSTSLSSVLVAGQTNIHIYKYIYIHFLEKKKKNIQETNRFSKQLAGKLQLGNDKRLRLTSRR